MNHTANGPTVSFEEAQRIEREKADMGVLVTADLIEVLAEDLPHAGPLQTDTVHVVVRDLDKLLEAEQSWML